MSLKFKAVVIDNQNEKFTREIKEIDTSHLKDGNVLVKIDYSSLNYKDALILNNGGKIVRKFPFVPGIDFINGNKMFLSDSIYNHQPKEGDVILFPHYLMHTAYPFKSSGERRSFSFNLEIDKKIANVFSR